MRVNYLIICLGLILIGCKNKDEKRVFENQSFVTIENGQFMVNGNPYYFIGTNFWYGPILGSQGEFGDRERLTKELDLLKANGINNLRILVGADGPDGVPSKVIPALQKAPGLYKERLFDGLDFFMDEIGKRDMYAVIYLHNTWEWSGGYAQYLNWAGYGPVPVPSVAGWDAFNDYVTNFFQCDSCTVLFKNHIAYILSRENFYNQRKYTEDPYILSWQIANEPRPMGEQNKEPYEKWLKEIAAFIKQLDSNHLVSTGSEGWEGSERDWELYTRVHADWNIDYLTMHIWPKNWSWIDPQDMEGTWENTIRLTDDYITQHIRIARELRKPITLEEFGFPRDKEAFSTQDPTTYRDKYYAHIFEQVLKSAEVGDVLAGCNFWAWGGYARPSGTHLFWEIGDDYMGDPAQEEQGLNSVFDTDTTMDIIRNYAESLEDMTGN